MSEPVSHTPMRKEVGGASAPRRPRPIRALSGLLESGHESIAANVRVLYLRRWLVAPVFIAVVLSVALYTWMTTPIYEGRVQLLIQVGNPNVVSFKEVLDSDRLTFTTDYYQTQYTILQSRTLAQQTLNALKLWHHPALGDPTDKRSFVARHLPRWAAALSARMFESEAASDAAFADETAEQSLVINRFLLLLSVEPVKNSRLVDVRFRFPDPAIAARVANTLARSYIDQDLDFKLQTAKSASSWLDRQLIEQRRRVEQAEDILQRYREKHDAVSLEDQQHDKQNIVVQKLGDLNAAVTRAKTLRIEKETLYKQLESIQHSEATLDTFPAVLSNLFIQQLKSELTALQGQRAQLAERLGDRHPEMVKVQSSIRSAETKLQNEIAKVVQSVRNEYLAAQAQERSLVAELDSQKTEALALDRKAIDYRALQRDATTNRQVFESLLQRAKEMGISEELRTSNIRIIDQAEIPRIPVSPQKLMNLALAMLGGGALALGLAFGLEYVDPRIKSPEELEKYLGLPFLGLVPEIDQTLITSESMALHPGSKALPGAPSFPASVTEAFWSVRASIILSGCGEAPPIVMVASASTSEGKTLIACNLGVSIAQVAHRVVIVDTDMRRPAVHTHFRVPLAPGLAEVLAGTATITEAMRDTGVPGLSVLPAGNRPSNPGGLLSSPYVKVCLENLSKRFDCVVLDCPPVLPVADSTLFAQEASGVVFVVNAQTTDRSAAETAVDRLAAAGAKFFGAVLNRVDIDRHPHYYGPYYREEYAKYYSEPVAGPRPRRERDHVVIGRS
jgi:polysaccharide biosynthesis transport protein